MNKREPFLNTLVSRLLLGWIVAGVVFLAIGLAFVITVFTATNGSPWQAERAHEMSRIKLLTLVQMLDGLRHLQAEAFINAGVLLILLTPIMRVVALSVYFLASRERTYGLISIATLLVLLMSLLSALR